MPTLERMLTMSPSLYHTFQPTVDFLTRQWLSKGCPPFLFSALPLFFFWERESLFHRRLRGNDAVLLPNEASKPRREVHMSVGLRFASRVLSR